MRLFHKGSEFEAPQEDYKTIYISYIKSILEKSSVVYHFSLTIQNEEDLEKVQKSAMKIILKENMLIMTKLVYC